MFGSTILEVAIGLSLLFLMMSLVASAVREGIEGVIKARAVNLERGIRALLDDEKDGRLTKILYEHPLINSLYVGNYKSDIDRFFGRNLPTYIPASNFAAALLDLVWRGVDVSSPYAAEQTGSVPSIADLQSSIHRIQSPQIRRALQSAIDRAEGDLGRVRQNLENWFDSAMNGVSGAYRRRTQLYLFIIGLILAASLNVNSFTAADRLWRDDLLRAQLVARADQVMSDAKYKSLARNTTEANKQSLQQAYNDLQALNLPIGWDRRPPAPPPGSEPSAYVAYWTKQLFGIALTAFAIMLGAPFWFDTLNKFIVIRSTVKPREKTGEEGSEDRTPQTKDRRPQVAGSVAGAQPTSSNGSSAAGTSQAGATAQQAPSSTAKSGTSPAGTTTIVVAAAEEPPHEDRVWRSAVEVGIL